MKLKSKLELPCVLAPICMYKGFTTKEKAKLSQLAVKATKQEENNFLVDTEEFLQYVKNNKVTRDLDVIEILKLDSDNLVSDVPEELAELFAAIDALINSEVLYHDK